LTILQRQFDNQGKEMKAYKKAEALKFMETEKLYRDVEHYKDELTHIL